MRAPFEALAEYRAAEAILLHLETVAAGMRADPKLQKDIEFSNRLKALMLEYGMQRDTVLAILDPGGLRSAAARPYPSNLRSQKISARLFRHPVTGETASEGAGGQTLRAWRSQYGTGVVDGWLQSSTSTHDSPHYPSN